MTEALETSAAREAEWPALPFEEWRPTCETLHRWSQVVGKVRLALAPMENHWWQVPLYATARGLTTSAMPYGGRALQIDFDFIDHRLELRESGGRTAHVVLAPRSVADFYEEVMARLREIGTPVTIHRLPVELADATPLDEDHEHASYDADAVRRFFTVLLLADRLMKRFRSGFLGKVSPVHFWWGSFDHAVTRFSGRGAPVHPGGVPNLPDWITREAYNAELSSAGFWPGSDAFPAAAFYTYAYPEPAGFADADPAAAGAYYHAEMREFVLPYDVARESADPDAAVLSFLEATYAAAATNGGWDRERLERVAPTPAALRRQATAPTR
jgi:hypothetical protein